MTLIIHAPNVHQGGGRALLSPLLMAAREIECRAIVDARLELPPELPESLLTMRVPPTLWGRLAGERRLSALAGPRDTILCFGNLPPLLSVSGRISLFIQNRYLLRTANLSGLTLGSRLRVAAERLWLRARLGQVDDVIVQTPSMAREVEAELGVSARVMPFLPAASPKQAVDRNAPRFDFLYVASDEPHKNHRTLLDAWKLLARDRLRPSLCLTLDPQRAGELLAWIQSEARANGLRIENAGALDRVKLGRLYAESAALVFPSGMESFGLPLIEAAAAGLPILAPELDYVRDVVVPAQTFDATSPVSLARAVKRHLGEPDPPVSPMTATEFLRILAVENR